MKIKYFGLGVVATLLILGLIAATPIIIEAPQDNNSTAILNYGRYQLSAWATTIGDKGGAIGAFVIDTATGETRTVYSRTYGDVLPSKVVKNNLKKPFHSIK